MFSAAKLAIIFGEDGDDDRGDEFLGDVVGEFGVRGAKVNDEEGDDVGDPNTGDVGGERRAMLTGDDDDDDMEGRRAVPVSD